MINRNHNCINGNGEKGIVPIPAPPIKPNITKHFANNNKLNN
jgi:hypothetical protein